MELAAKRRERIMAQMARMQRNFIRENKELFETTSSDALTPGDESRWDDVEIACSLVVTVFRDVTEPAEIRFRQIRISCLTSVRIWMRMQIYRGNYLQTVLPNENAKLAVIASYSTCFVSFFDAVGVAVFIVYHFVHSCRPGTQSNVLFFNAQPNLNATKNCLCTPDRFRCGKILWFQQRSNPNSNSVTPLPIFSYLVLLKLNF